MRDLRCPSCGPVKPRLQWRWESMSQGRAPGRLLVLVAWCTWCMTFIDVVSEHEYATAAPPRPI